MQETWTISRALEWTANHFKSKGIQSPRLDAELLLSHLLGKDRIYLYTHYDQPLQQEELRRYREFIQRRVKYEPVAYITGHKEFWSLDFKVAPPVLIPRPETEILIETALGLSRAEFAGRSGRALDLCTGSGNISISLSRELPDWTVYAIDISPAAMEIAAQNASLNHVRDRIKFILGDLFTPLETKGKFDFILSNPPYIAHDDLTSLPPEIKDYEPRISLDGGAQGIQILKKIIREAPEFLTHGGYLIMEIGSDQPPLLENLFSPEIWGKLYFINDYSGLPRVLVARKGQA